MNEYHYRLIGNLLALIGVTILFFPLWVFFLPSYIFWEWFGGQPQPSDILIFQGFMLLGFILACSGVIIHIRFKRTGPFLAKGGKPIHTGTPWKKRSESGLFLTTCGLVVSINQESSATAHVGYRIVSAEHATCSDCAVSEGRLILESHAHGRMSDG